MITREDVGSLSKSGGLGRYVECRGEEAPRYFMCVPDDVRPEGWPRMIELPTGRSEPRSLRRTATLREKVALDAARLNAEIDLLRAGSEEGETLLHLANGWMRSDRWSALCEERKYTTRFHLSLIARWSSTLGHPPVSLIKLSMIEEFLRSFNDRPSLKTQVRSALNVLFCRAMAEGYISHNPTSSLKWSPPRTRPPVWSENDLRTIMAEAHHQGMPGLAALICTMWSTGQRLGDMCRLRHGEEYTAGHIVMIQSKTRRAMRIPVAPHLAAEIEAARTDSPHLFTDRAGDPFTPRSASYAFRRLRASIPSEHIQELQLRQLRHTCVTRLAKAGATVLQIAGLTGHNVACVHNMLEHYFVADNELTRQVIEMDLKNSGFDPTSLPASSKRFLTPANEPEAPPQSVRRR